MLVDAKKKELLVLYEIIQSDTCSLQDLSNKLVIPKRTVKDLIRKLNQAISQLLEFHSFIYSTHKGEIQINEHYEKTKMQVFYYLKLIFLRESQRFNYLLLLMDSLDASVAKEELTQKLYISSSYLEKLTTRINKDLKKFNLQIISSNNCYTLSGDELLIRIYIYIFLSDAFQGPEWPFTTIDLATVKQEITLSDAFQLPFHSETEQKNIYLLYAVFKLRIKQASFLEPLENDIQQLLKLLFHTCDLTGSFKQNMPVELPEKHTENEVFVLNFMILCFFPSWVHVQQKLTIGKCFMQTDHVFCQFTQKLTVQLAKHFPTIDTTEKIAFYHYFITLAFTFVSLLGESIIEFHTLYFPTVTETVSADDSQVQLILTEINALCPAKLRSVHVAHYLGSLIYQLIRSETDTQLLIHLKMTKTLTGNYHLKNRLEKLFNHETVLLTFSPEKADLIVTDWFEAAQQAIPSFYWNLTNEEVSWQKLVLLIQTLYDKKTQINTTQNLLPAPNNHQKEAPAFIN
ncbi:helix-turn-helix domain-containing protein [Enterococcus thailandicus]|uniref:Transcriptional regulator n=1 Tax=Enterococcus thailandicus TaxID=417368 RepID=A0A510WIG1_ENTTH|nr:helix-turn-helix domain-containing protein [Enterococcus thailandicus]MDT2795086.1 helix-turn-helix domain-containing protein [Enterococcus thailandicus]OJG94832.1 ribonuclease P protein component [Enterococcus thailandicus]GEK37455.1 transcriptional regulator [Enterococcus thailandicus]